MATNPAASINITRFALVTTMAPSPTYQLKSHVWIGRYVWHFKNDSVITPDNTEKDVKKEVQVYSNKIKNIYRSQDPNFRRTERAVKRNRTVCKHYYKETLYVSVRI